jgi:hypothetical protein
MVADHCRARSATTASHRTGIAAFPIGHHELHLPVSVRKRRVEPWPR